MSNEKQQLINAIETLPDNLASQAYNYIEYLKLSYVDEKAPESVTIKSKEDLQKKLQEGFDDIKANKVYSLEEFFDEIDKM